MSQPTPPAGEDLAYGLAEIARLTEANDSAINALRAQKIPIGLDTVIAQRLLTLLDRLLGPADGEHATAERVAYELDFHHRLAAMLEQAQAEARKATLLQGVQLNGHAPAGRPA